MLSNVLFLTILAKTAQSLNRDPSLVFQYFTKIHPVTHVILFTSNLEPIPDLILNFSRKNILVEHINPDEDIELETSDVFHATNVPVGVYVEQDEANNRTMRFLEVASDEKYFNSSYFWLIEGYDNETVDDDLGSLFHIQMNSQITFVQKIDEEKSHLIDVYSYGRHLRYELVTTVFAEWFSDTKKLIITKEFPLMYRKEYRGDFKELVMRQAVVIAKRPNNHSIESIDKLMTEPGTTQDILSLVKYHHNQGLVLKQRTRVNRIAKDITGAWIRGLRTGGLGILTRNETDVSSTGGIVTLCRFKEFDYIHTRLMLKADFFYRVTPELIGKGEKKITFLIPFNGQVWCCVIVTFALIGILVKMYSKTLQEKYESTIIYVFSIAASQGVALTYNHVFRRIITLTGQLLVIMILTVYAAQLLKVILTPAKDPFGSRQDLMNSDIHLARYTIWGLAVIVFKQLETSNRPDYNERFMNTAQDVAPKALDKRTITVFDNYYEGLQYMKHGPLAFTGESSNIQYLIKRTFSPDEICEIKKQKVIYTPQYFVMKKHSQYSRVFMIGLLKADESGILQNVKNKFYEEMPPCVAGVKIYSVPFTKIKGAIFLLSLAAILSWVIFALEHLWSRFHFEVFHSMYARKRRVHMYS